MWGDPFSEEERAIARKRLSALNGAFIQEELKMLRLIDADYLPGGPIPESIDLEALFDVVSGDISDAHNRQADPAVQQGKLPPSQRRALGIPRNPETPVARSLTTLTLPWVWDAKSWYEGPRQHFAESTIKGA